MEINYLVVLGCAVLGMIGGALWYGPLLGKVFMRSMGVDPNDPVARVQMQKGATKLYILQFLILLLQFYIFAHFVEGRSDVSGAEVGAWLWLGFIVPTLAGVAMWTTEPAKRAWTRVAIIAGYQLVLFTVIGTIFSMWG